MQKLIKKFRKGEEDREKKIAKICLEAILKFSSSKEFEKVKEDIVFSLIALDPGNPLLFNFMKRILKAKDIEKMREIAKKGIEYIEIVPRKIAQYWRKILEDGNSVLIPNYSTNARELVLEASKNIELEVTVCEGSPTYMGRKLAKELSKSLKVTLIPDTAVNYVMPEIDVVLSGGLAITKFGLIGRVGTSMVALTAKWYKVPFYALVETMKFSERIIIRELKLKNLPKNVIGRSPGYDLTRNEFITAYVCEEGIIKPKRFYPFAMSIVERW